MHGSGAIEDSYECKVTKKVRKCNIGYNYIYVCICCFLFLLCRGACWLSEGAATVLVVLFY